MHHFSNDEVLDGTEEPLRVYFACYTMLEKIGDSRAAGILQKAMQLLQAQVSKFSVEESSRMYIENFPWRRAIEQIWLAKQEQAKEYRR